MYVHVYRLKQKQVYTNEEAEIVLESSQRYKEATPARRKIPFQIKTRSPLRA